MFHFFLYTNPVHAATNSEALYSRVNSDINASNSFIDEVQSFTDSPSNDKFTAIMTKITIMENHFNESSLYYENLVNQETDEKLRNILADIKGSIDGINTSIRQADKGITLGNREGLASAFNSYDVYTERLNNSVQDLDEYYGIYDYVPLLAASFWVSLALSIGLFVMSRGNPLLPAEKLRNQFEFALFKSSLWPFAGSAISYTWALLTPPGGTYHVFWWLIVVGFFQFGRGLYSYLRYYRPAINIAKREEQAKLEELLMSDKFQQQNLKEKAGEISKLEPVIRTGH